MILWLLACTSPTPTAPSPPPPAPEPEALSSVAYRFTWRTPDARVTQTPSYLLFDTDKGVRVRLDEATLVTYGAWLRPCPKKKASLGFGWSSAAHAGHSALSNPTASAPAFVEDLLRPTPVTRGPLALEEPTWCGVEALMARADNKTDGVTPVTKGTSIRLVGWWSNDLDALPVPFTWTSTLHHSATAPLAWSGEGVHGQVEVRRTLSGMFDGIDFDATPPPRILRGVLANLAENTTFTTTRRPANKPSTTP